MGDTRFGKPAEENLDWDNLDRPVPMDLIDPEFPAHAPFLESRPGAASEILPREESEALAREADGTEEAPADRTIEMTQGRLPTSQSEGTLEMPARGAPSMPPPGATLFGGTDALQDDFARIRAKMDAEAAEDKLKKAETEKEEASQRERLEQWMANARARLLKADADLTGPSGRIRIRKESSPSLYRLAEMQKTIYSDGEATQADGAKPVPPKPAPPLDPMATISVPTEQFLTLDAPAQPTMREQALAKQAAQQAAQVAAVQQAATRHAEEQKAQAEQVLAARAVAAQAKQNLTAFTPMTREEALTRKVAKLRKVAGGSDNTLMVAAPMGEGDDRSALNFAVAAVVVIAILVLGLGLFAATQAGLFDGLENRIPFLKPKIAAVVPAVQNPQPPAAPSPAPVAQPAQLVQPKAAAVAPSPSREIPPANQPAPTTGRPANYAEIPPGNQPTAAELRNLAATQAVRPAPKPPTPAAVKTPTPRAPKPEPVRAAKVKKPAPAAVAAAADDDGEIPAYAKPRAKASNLGEIILRASVQAASNIDKDNLLELYNRYALGFPGLSGEVVIGLTVDPGGRILEGSIVSSTTGVDAFDQELLRKVLDWRLRSFPDSRPKFISVPFLFPLQGH